MQPPSWFGAISRWRAPVEFFAQRLIVAVAGDLDELKLDRGLAEHDLLTGGDRDDLLAIDHQGCSTGSLADVDGVCLVRRIDHGSIGESVRADGRDDQRGQLLTQDGTTC